MKTSVTKIALATTVLAVAAVAGAQDHAMMATTTAAVDNNEGLKAIGKGLALGLGALGTAIAQARIGSSMIGSLSEDPSKFGTFMLIFLLPETLVILGFVALFMI